MPASKDIEGFGQELSVYVGEDVRIKKNQGRLGGDKYPGRFGTIVKSHPISVPEPLFYVALKPTDRAKGRIDTFWLRDLIFMDNNLNL